MALRIDHVGIVVRDLRSALDEFGDLLGVPDADRTVSEVIDPESGETVDAGFLQIGENRIEFICPRPGSRSRFAEHLSARGESLFHVSVYSDDFAQTVRCAAEKDPAIEVLTVRMTPPSADGSPSSMQRIVNIAWVPPSLTRGVNVELVDANATLVPVTEEG